MSGKIGWNVFRSVVYIFFAVVFIASCGGGGGGGGDDDDNGDTPIVKTITGVAAAGVPIVGTINIRGANGNTSFSAIETDGSFTVDVSALVEPFVVWAEGSANGKGVKLYSTVSVPSSVNVTPVTNAIVAMAIDSDPDEYFSNGSPAPPSDSDLELAKQVVFDLLEDVFATLEMPDNFDLMNGEFEADGTGFDNLLDVVSFPIEEGSLEIIDNSTGTTLYEEVLDTGVVNEEKSPEEIDSIVGSGLTILESIQSDMLDFTDLYASGIPTLTELQSILAPIMATTFLDDGYDANDTLVRMASGDAGPPPGIEILGMSIHRNMQTQNFTVGDTPVAIDEKRGNYDGVWAIITFGLGDQSGTVVTSYVQETQGEAWKWNGNQCPFPSGGNINAQADRIIQSGNSQAYSGLDVVIVDRGNLAKDTFGIIGTVIMNDALPLIENTEYYGLISRRPADDIITQYEITNSPDPLCNENSQYYESCGLDIDTITNIEFVYIGFDELDDPQLAWISLLESKPIKESLINTDPSFYFPVINAVAGKSPDSQFSVSDFEDSVTIDFTPLTNYPVGGVELGLSNSSDEYYNMDEDNPNGQDPGWTTVTFDTSPSPIGPPTRVFAKLWYRGDFEKEFSVYYYLDLQ
jgi:hypothetical protein